MVNLAVTAWALHLGGCSVSSRHTSLDVKLCNLQRAALKPPLVAANDETSSGPFGSIEWAVGVVLDREARPQLQLEGSTAEMRDMRCTGGNKPQVLKLRWMQMLFLSSTSSVETGFARIGSSFVWSSPGRSSSFTGEPSDFKTPQAMRLRRVASNTDLLRSTSHIAT